MNKQLLFSGMVLFGIGNPVITYVLDYIQDYGIENLIIHVDGKRVKKDYCFQANDYLKVWRVIK